LVQGAIVKAKGRAYNTYGWGDYNELNLIGAVIEAVPAQMAAVTRGDLTSESQLQILWTGLTGDATGGTSIDSYELLRDSVSLLGASPYQLLTTHLQTTSVTPATSYSFTVRAHNAHGWGTESPAF
jgi:hypothetical protein